METKNIRIRAVKSGLPGFAHLYITTTHGNFTAQVSGCLRAAELRALAAELLTVAHAIDAEDLGDLPDPPADSVPTVAIGEFLDQYREAA